MLFNKSPSCTHFRVFSSLCFISTLKQDRKKFYDKAHPCVFVSYPLSIKGYKLFDVVDNKYFISRDIHFIEHIFPFIFLLCPSIFHVIILLILLICLQY